MTYNLDDNHAEIVEAFRRIGCPVAEIAKGKSYVPGIPDLAVGLPNGSIAFVEIKNGANTLSEAQKFFFDEWEGFPVYVVRTVDDVLKVAGI